MKGKTLMVSELNKKMSLSAKDYLNDVPDGEHVETEAVKVWRKGRDKDKRKEK